jgi:ATP-dependent DNA helicase DinG
MNILKPAEERVTVSQKKDPVSLHFDDSSVQTIKTEISKARGNEVLFFGWTDEDSIVVKTETIARGSEECVAFPLERSFIADVVIHNHPGDNLTPSEADLNIASVTANRGVGFFIVNNDVTEVYVAVEPVAKDTKKPVDAELLKPLVAKDGPCSKTVPDFEERNGQMEMIEHVCAALNGSTCGLIEAGTGIGKSLAYLIPSVEWSRKNMERVVISTKTINLQEQLLYKDIPGLKKALDADFSYILMKGRGNYICLNRVADAQQDLFSFVDDEELGQFNILQEWIKTTDDGSLSDLNFVPSYKLWEKVNSQSDTCLGSSCRYFSRCFVNRVKRKALTAGIIVTNHHYLLADVSLIPAGNSILPSFDRVIIDEAHNLEDSATSFFTREVTLSSVLRLLDRLYSGEKKKKGFLMFLLRKGKSGSPGAEAGRSPVRWASLTADINRIMGEVSELRNSSYALFEAIDEFMISAANHVSDGSRRNDFTVCEVRDEVKNLPGWESGVIKRLGFFYSTCTGLSNSLYSLREKMSQDAEESVLKQIDSFTYRLIDVTHTVDAFLNDEDKSYVRWIEKKRDTALMVSLIDVGEALQELLFSRVKSTVLTSATLTVDGKFDFIKRRLRLNNEVFNVIVESPFNYNEQMAVIIPSDMVEPDLPGYVHALSISVGKILDSTGGKAFVLFTSYKTLNDVYESISEELRKSGLFVFKQGDGSRMNLLKEFKINTRSVLFGTESFWEGVDAPGDTLECVIITKLPFKVPTDPVVKARMERVRMEGGNPFMDYSLPLAVIKLKQGVGRLIRKRTDRGIIAVLDKRVLVKRYGRVFINSIPGGNIYGGMLEETLQKTKGYVSNNSLTKKIK